MQLDIRNMRISLHSLSAQVRRYGVTLLRPVAISMLTKLDMLNRLGYITVAMINRPSVNKPPQVVNSLVARQKAARCRQRSGSTGTT